MVGQRFNRQEAGDGLGEGLKGRTLWIPRMTNGGVQAVAAAFRSIGVEAMACPDADARAMELGGQVTSGEECLPEKVTLGTFLGIALQPGFVPSQHAFFMPTSGGPCRFGQYTPFVKKVLSDLHLEDIYVFSPTSENDYKEVGGNAGELKRTAWRAVVASDLLRKFLHQTRPYETHPGDTDRAYEASLGDVCGVLEEPGLKPSAKLLALREALGRGRDRFRAVPADYSKPRPLIGVVGEIFCRLNTYSCDNLMRRIEEQGGEGWLSDVSEWLWYTNFETLKRIKKNRPHSLQMLGHVVKSRFQRHDEHTLLAPFQADLAGYEEPADIREILEGSLPYLPHYGALGEMTLSAGKAVYLFEKGADGIVDVSPFSCMNGIVCEAIYPRISAEHHGIPIKNFYFDGTHKDLDTRVGIFVELARTYSRRKKKTRRLPFYFGG